MMRLFRGIAVAKTEVEHVISLISSRGLSEEGAKVYTWQQPTHLEHLLKKSDLSRNDTQGPRDASPVGICASGDEASAAVYAWDRNRCLEDDTPILIEVEVGTEIVAIDGNDFLYPAFQFGTAERLREPLEATFGKKILRYAYPAWETNDFNQRLAFCDLAIHDPDVIKEHHANKLIIGGRCHTKFRSSFLVRLPICSKSIVRAWRPSDFLPLPSVDYDIYELIR